jgi:4-amino-4-deoxy-L-arabinose transferase-like glycosyltransferase
VVDDLTERIQAEELHPQQLGLFDRAGAWVRQNPALTAIVVTAFALRLGWVLYVDVSAPTWWRLSGDQYSYYRYGRDIAAGHGYNSYITGEPTAYYPIGYPAILATVFFVVGHTPLPDDYVLAANLLHVVLGTASVVLGYLIGRRLLGRVAGLAAAAILAVFPNLVFQVASFQLEVTFIFLCLAALAIVVVHDWDTGGPSTPRLLAFGAVLGVAVLVRPFAIWFVVALFVAALAACLGWRRSLRAAAIPLAVVVGLSIPWMIRNAIRLDALVVTSTNTGDTLCLDRFDGATGEFRLAEHEGCADPALPEVEQNNANTRKAVRWVIDNPRRELIQIWRRARLMYASDHDGIEAVNTLGGGPVMAEGTARRLSRLADVSFAVVGVLAVGGLVVLLGRRNRGRPEVLLVLLSMASLIAVPLLLWGNPRFHLPVSPFFAILAGVAVAAAVQFVDDRRAG